MKTKKAISLIVLVITIIVMIILASAVIITLSNTGIIGKAQEAVDKTNMAQIKEDAEMIKWDLKLTNSKLTQAELVTKLNEHFEQSTVAGNVITTGKYDITVGEDLTLTVGKHQGSTDPEDPDEPTEESIWEAYDIYDALANISDEALAANNVAIDREYHTSTYIKVVSKYKQYTLQEYKEQYLLNTMLQAQVPNLTIDDFVLVVTGATSMNDVLYAYGQQLGTTITRDQLVYNVLFQYGDVDTALQAIGYTPSEIEAEYAALEQTEVPTEIANKTYTITYPDGSEETVQGSNLSTYIGRYGITTSGEYEITISDATTEETLTVNILKVVPATYEDEYYTYTFISPRVDPNVNTCGYYVSVKDKTLSEYGTILTHVAGLPIVYLNSTFHGCTNLTIAPKIPNTVTDMSSTFSGCNSLTTVPNIPNSVTDMDSTFRGCTNLTTVPALPDTVIVMGSTFSSCSGLTTVPNIPNSVTDMDSTFWNCTNLTTVPALPNTVTSMGGTFYNCTNLTTVPNIPTSVTNMDSTFSSCSSLTTVPNIPNTVTDMDSTFCSCENLMTVPALPNTVTSMGATFRDCSSLTTVPNIPTSVTNMTYTFWNCTNLTTVPDITSTSLTNMHGTFLGCTNLTIAPKIPSSVTNMTYTFLNCTNLTTVQNIPNSVTDMTWTFQECYELEGIIHINSTALTSANNPFVDCATKGSGLTVVVPNDTVRQLLIDKSGYTSTYVTIVKELAG